MCYHCCAEDLPSTRVKLCCGCCLVDCCECCNQGGCAHCLNCICCRVDNPNQIWNDPYRCCCGLCPNPLSCCQLACDRCRFHYCTCTCCCCICDPLACCCGEYKGDIRLLQRDIYNYREAKGGAPQSDEGMTR